MKRRLLFASAALAIGAASTASAGGKSCANRVNNNIDKLTECVTIDGVRAHQAALQAIADANGGIRTSGTSGYDASAEYVYNQLAAAGYNVEYQPFMFNAFIELGPSTLAQTAPGSVVYEEGTDYVLMAQTEPGAVSGLAEGVDLSLGDPALSTSGCEAADFAGFTPGNIAIVQRGACFFRTKAENAAAAGAVGIVIFNQGTPGRFDVINGTLGSDNTADIPAVFSTYDLGVLFATTPGLTLDLVVDVFRGEATANNVIAESKSGDPTNVVMAGAHLDSVNEGPGIQDNGTGSAAILEAAIQMAKVKPRNKIRFAWWGAEESGLVGSTRYVEALTAEQIEDIALYLNFDMIGSPNHVFFVYDGDDSDEVGAGPGPEGSAQIETFFENFYTAVGEPFKGTDFSGRSDYGPFIAVGIPAGGLFTGAEGIKTDEEVELWGGTAGDQYDPCYHLACDTFDNINLHAFDVNSDAVAASILQYGMNTESINAVRGKGNFKPEVSEYLGKKLQM